MPNQFREQETRVHLSPQVKQELGYLWNHKAWKHILEAGGTTWPLLKVGLKPCQSICDRDTGGEYIYESNERTDDEEEEEDDDDNEDEENEDEEEEEYNDNDDEDNYGNHHSGLDPHGRASKASYAFRMAGTSDRPATLAMVELVEQIFQLSIILIIEEFTNGQPASTLLVYFSGILGFSSDCQCFEPARRYCTNLSGLIYIQRLLFLEYALPLEPYHSIGIQKRPTTDQLERLNKIRERYMLAGSLTPLAELHSLRNFGREIAYTEPPSFLLHWSDDGNTVSYGDALSLSMDTFRQLSNHFITQAEEVCAELMLGLNPVFDLNIMKDDIANEEIGYSFVMHPQNNISRMYEQLLVQACTTKSSSLFWNGRWSHNAIKAYLKRVTILEKLILGGLYTSCGQAPRLRELLTLICENGPSGTRGIFVWNGYIIYILRHHKAKRITNREFYMVRFLLARLGSIVLRYLILIRRFSAMLQRELRGHLPSDLNTSTEQLLFQTNGKPWTSSYLTRIIKNTTAHVWKQPVNAQTYRQLAIGIIEKHVHEVYLPLNRFDDRSTKADLNVAFAWQSGHRPLQRGVVYGLDGAFPHQLQPSLLRAYE